MIEIGYFIFMSKILFVNPNKWGRGVTAIWIASHAAYLKKQGHDCALFDCTFYSCWTDNENAYNTANSQYQPTGYDKLLQWEPGDVYGDLQSKVDAYQPDIIFSAALTSHIHGEGEYASIQYYHELMVRLSRQALVVAGGLQPTADLQHTASRFPSLDYLIAGESELVLGELATHLKKHEQEFKIPGLVKIFEGGKVDSLIKQPIMSDLDCVGEYDYSLFEEQMFLRPYNGEVVRAVDYELSRGCIYTCSYCVETVIQRYYGFSDASKRGALLKPKAYVRAKSAERTFTEIKHLHEQYGITLFRCQDTNFLTIPATTLKPLSEMINSSGMDIKLYIETRPEGINESTIELMKKLKIDGVGMGVEAADEQYREGDLHRYADQSKIERAFELLHKSGIKGTAYNVIGFPHQSEESILDTIRLNIRLKPDNVTVAFYAPFIGTDLQQASASEGLFDEYAYNADPQLRTNSAEGDEKIELLNFYKKNFVRLVRHGLEILPALKSGTDEMVN